MGLPGWSTRPALWLNLLSVRASHMRAQYFVKDTSVVWVGRFELSGRGERITQAVPAFALWFAAACVDWYYLNSDRKAA